MQILVRHHRFDMLREKALWWKKRSTLLIADMHLGKASHFRKHGIPVPNRAATSNYSRLSALIEKTGARRVIFLGDLFHSHRNREWDHIGDYLRGHGDVKFVLIRGNHDVVENEKIAGLPIEFYEQCMHDDGLLLSHDAMESGDEFNIYGHIHPAVRMSGLGRQWLRLPCFYFGQRSAILPAFGDFTGVHAIRPAKGDRVYVPLESSVMQVC